MTGADDHAAGPVPGRRQARTEVAADIGGAALAPDPAADREDPAAGEVGRDVAGESGDIRGGPDVRPDAPENVPAFGLQHLGPHMSAGSRFWG